MDEIHDIVKRMRTYKCCFVLDPERWDTFNPLTDLNWTSVKFDESNINNIPQNKGIYAFVIKFNSVSSRENLFPIHGYITYGGITGYKQNSNRNLRTRFKEYLKEKGKRPLIYEMINFWKNNLYFFYSEINDTEIDLLELEKQFNDSVIPPFVQNDFSGIAKRAKKAAFSF